MQANTIGHGQSMESLVGSQMYSYRGNTFIGTNEEIIKDVEERVRLGQGEAPHWLQDLKLKSEQKEQTIGPSVYEQCRDKVFSHLITDRVKSGMKGAEFLRQRLDDEGFEIVPTIKSE